MLRGINGKKKFFTALLSTSAALCLLPVQSTWAQRANENAIENASDAFGGSVGTETTGIYTESDIRGFSPQRAGNARLNGFYFDQVGQLSYRLKGAVTMRVGLAALNYPFPAPTGIVDYALRSSGNEQILSVSAAMMAYNGYILEADLQQPILKDRATLGAGIGTGVIYQPDGSKNTSYAFSIRPQFRFASLEISPFVSASLNRDQQPILLFQSTGAFAPNTVPKTSYLGQSWTGTDNDNANYGVLTQATLFENVSFRASWFHSEIIRHGNFSEIYSYATPTGLPNHTIIADPRQKTYSNSWEAMLAFTPKVAGWQNRVLVGARGRERGTQTGGSAVFPYGLQALGTQNAEPVLTFGALNNNTVTQSSLMVGYIVEKPGRAQLNLGLQRATYEAVSRKPTGSTTATAEPWLYNVSFSWRLSKNTQVFAGYVKGLEDSGTAPETAVNRNEQLPASLTEQFDAGIQLQLGGAQIIASIFQVQKPYFTFDAANRFDVLGNVKHRGVELSVSGKLTDRLRVVAGAVLIDGRVTSALPSVGSKPVGVPSSRIRVDVNYRTDFWGNFTPTASLMYLTERAGTANRFAALGGDQVMLPSSFKLDIGFRSQFVMGGIPASIRVMAANVLDEHDWKPVASGVYQVDDYRRYTITLIADF